MVIRTKGTIYAPDLYEFPNRTLYALEKPNRGSKKDGEDHDSAVRRAGPQACEGLTTSADPDRTAPGLSVGRFPESSVVTVGRKDIHKGAAQGYNQPI